MIVINLYNYSADNFKLWKIIVNPKTKSNDEFISIIDIHDLDHPKIYQIFI